MLLRVRLPNGSTQRVTLDPSNNVDDLGLKINALANLDGTFSLHSNPAFTQPFVFDSASNGDMVFVKGTLATSEPVAAAPSSQGPSVGRVLSTAAPVERNDQETAAQNEKAPLPKPDLPKLNSNCKPHCFTGRGMCEHCVPKEDKHARHKAEIRRWQGKGSSLAVMEALEALKTKISPQANAHAAAAAVNNDAAQAFQAYLATTGFSQQRMGYCYGSVDEDNNTVVHTIYEPPQCGDASSYTVVEGEEAGDISDRANKVAELLGMNFVGIAFSAGPRKSILSGKDVVFAARMASQLSPELQQAFVVLIVTTTEAGETVFEAYQISDLAMELYNEDIFEEISKQKPNGGRVMCKSDVLVEGKDARKVHTEFFLLNIPIKSSESWIRTVFPVENRDVAPQSPADMKRIIDDETIPYEKRLADFHLLLFLSNIFDMKSDMPALCTAVKDGGEIDEGFRLMIENMASPS